jgi:hypothetical protein
MAHATVETLAVALTLIGGTVRKPAGEVKAIPDEEQLLGRLRSFD